MSEEQDKELTKEQLFRVDEILLHWADAGLCAYGKNPAGETIVRVENLARVLRTLAHCAALTGLQGLVTGRCEENRGPDMALGFIAAAKAVEYLADRCSTKAVKLCSSDPHEYLNKEWNELSESRDHVIDDIERVAPGWYAKAQERIAALKEKEPERTPPEMDPAVSKRIAAAKAGIVRTETGDIRLRTVERRLYGFLGEPNELMPENIANAEVHISDALVKDWSGRLHEFIGGYEAAHGDRLSDNEVEYLHDLVRGRMTAARRAGYVRLVGAERRDVRFRSEDFK